MSELFCGVDEAGRGPLAGPVAAAAVILPHSFPVELLADSKKLTPRQRLSLERLIKVQAFAWALGWAWPEEIDRTNILKASLLAMQRAILDLGLKPDLIYVDGPFAPPCPYKTEPVIGADHKIPQVMAASILAKVARDRFMERYARIEPAYQYERHKGYPTQAHLRLLQELGPSAIQRLSFRLR